ncbi:MAG: DEAD/DEAH box helicase family protein [Planctomycetes bacterium]|nr:DEAD/DEAH box helicase family protein [Planctomycetota bacterium]
MKLKFDANLPYQLDAIKATIEVFEGQPAAQMDYATAFETSDGELFKEVGLSNPTIINTDRILENVHRIQEANDIPKSRMLLGEGEQGGNGNYKFPNFSVEMETGTGKTYVYLRTIFDLNAKYGFKKFIIVVPSVAIREGVLKSIEVTKEHFGAIYNKVPFDYFVYDSKKLGKVRQFATSNQIQVMIINVQAFLRDEGDASNIIHQERDAMSGRRPIEFIQAANPIIIIDEPQSVDNTPKSRRAIQQLNPVACFRYSATHINPYNLLYKLDPIKAYDLRLVKRIEVSSVCAAENFNDVLVRLDKVEYAKDAKTPHAKVTINVDTPNGPRTKTFTVKQGDDLYERANQPPRNTARPEYQHGFIITNISAEPGLEHIEFNNGKMIRLGQEEGGMAEEVMKAQIRETIERHLQKELKMKDKGVKVLSLFFIDRVANYRSYREDGTPQKGRIAQWFEEAFTDLTGKPLYRDVLSYPIQSLHNGYFSQDKKGVVKDTRGNTQDDEDTYSLIMRDKEKLLSPEEPLRFIFSHSALKEGWDNPNVFQLCSLREMGTERERRQIIGRGLRLPVNKDGERVYDDTINRLTVIAGESFEEYARGLQEDIERDCQVKFGRIEKTAFARLVKPAGEGEEEKPIGQDASAKIWEDLHAKGYIDEKGDIQDKFDPSREGFILETAPENEPVKGAVLDEMRRYIFKNRIVNVRERRTLRFKKEVALNEDFKALWERINKKTSYSVEFDTEDLIKQASLAIKDMEAIRAVTISTTREELEVTKAGVQGGRILEAKSTYASKARAFPDILAFLQRETELTRHTIVRILKASSRLQDFTVNPQAFMTEVAKHINRTLHGMIVDGIKYEKIAGQEYEMRLFEEDEIESYLANLYAVQSKDKTLYDYIPYDSEIEREFARQLDGMENVRLFVKLPRWFVVKTPIGDYNPDWAIVAEYDHKVYLVRETKGSIDDGKLRTSENQKIKCGRRHFKTLGVDFKTVKTATEALTPA